MAHLTYRPEIDGLRAIAVVSVVVFHAFPWLVPGGFVGVDIFFVISGFLITGILIADLQAGTYSIARFYERRARRILPALFVVMAACIPFAWAWMLPGQITSFGESLIAVVAFLSNALFYAQTDYFAADSELQPLLHTWSLAVEEQFYVVFPVFLALAWRLGRKPLIGVIAVLAVASLGFAEWNLPRDGAGSFYLAHARAWELLAGSLAAFALQGRAVPARNLPSLAGLALILYPLVAFDAATPFPGLHALPPVVGTALILVFAGQGTWVGRLLSTRPFVGVGLISYSTYLWHQPLLAFARIRSLTPPQDGLLAGLCLLALVLGWASWKWIESPFRGKTPLLPRRAVLFGVSAALGLAVIGGGVVLKSPEMAARSLARYDAELMSYADYPTDFMRPACFLTTARDDFALYDQKACLATTGRKTLLMLGNSHMAQFGSAFPAVFPDRDVLQATSSGCTGLLPIRGGKRCTDLFHFIYEDWLPGKHFDTIVFDARVQKGDVKGDHFAKTAAFLAQYADEVIFIGPVVEYEPELYTLLARRAYFGSAMSEAEAAKAAEVAQRHDFDRAIAAQLKDLPKVRYFSFLNEICKDGCPLRSAKGELYTFDYGHLTRSAAEEVIGRLRAWMD